MNNKDYGIFNECKFINEEIILNEGIIGLSFLGFYGIIGLIIATYCISDKIRNNKIRNRINKKLNNAKKRNKDIENFDKNRKDIKSISLKELLNRLGKDINETDEYNLKHNKISIFTIDDKSGNMIAYTIYDELDNGLMDIGINILKSYPKIVNNYIKALFELHIGIYGDGLKSFIKDLNKMPHPEKSFSKRVVNTPNLSNEESRKLKDDIKDIRYNLYNFLKSKLNKYNIEVNEIENVIHISEKEVPKDIKEYEDYINHTDNIEDEVSNILNNFADKYKIYYNNGIVKGTKDKWPCIRISHVYDYETECVIIIISTTNV